jgi:hypothetical protein
MAPAKSVGASSSTDSVELAKYLWEEYKYRHDLIWRLLFRVTTVVVLLSIAPFTIDNLTKEAVGVWVQFLPALAMGVAAVGWLLLLAEFRLFSPVDCRYVEAQTTVVGKTLRKRRIDHFKWMIMLYMPVLLLLTTIVGCIVWFRPRS